MDSLDERLAALETRCQKLEERAANLETLVVQLQNGSRFALISKTNLYAKGATLQPEDMNGNLQLFSNSFVHTVSNAEKLKYQILHLKRSLKETRDKLSFKGDGS